MGFVDSLKKSALGALSSTPAGLVSGGLGQMFSSISQGRSWKYRQKEMELQQQYNERNMRLQFDYARKAFDMENEYNDPRNAVARWRAAGIAPQAVFGSSPGGAGVAGSLSTPDSSNPSGSNVDGSAQYAPVMTLGDIQRMENETKVADSQADLNAAKAEEARANAEGQRQENSLFDLTKRAKEAQVISVEQQAEVDKLNRQFLEETLDTRVKQEQKKLDNLAQQYNQMASEIALNNAKKELTEEEARVAMQQVLTLQAQAALTWTQNEWHGKISQANINELSKRIEKYASEVDLNTAKKFLTSAQEWNATAATDKLREEIRGMKQRNDVYDSSAGEFVLETEAIIKAISPFKF